MFEFEPCACCTSPMACRDRNYCNADEAAHYDREADRLMEAPRVQVHVGGDKTEMRAIESMDAQTGELTPVLRPGEEIARTICGKIMIIRARY